MKLAGWRWRLLLVVLAGLLVKPAAAQSDPGLMRMRAAVANLMSHYEPGAGLWSTEGWWNGANSTMELGLAQAVDPAGNYGATLDRTFKLAPAARVGTQKPHPGFLNDYYDDEGWWALAWIQAYDVTHREQYLTMAEAIFADMTTGWDQTCGGGIWWRKDRHYKNAIANELFLSVAAHLAGRVQGRQGSEDKGWAEREWRWFDGSGMINAAGLVNDGLTPDCANNGRQTWSYNQGVILGGLVELARVDGDAGLLAKANGIAQAAIGKLSDAAGVLHDGTEPHCSGDSVQFKGIFMRNLVALEKASPHAAYRDFVLKNADAVWTEARTAGGGFACQWNGPAEDRGAGATTSALGPLVGAVGLR